MSNIRQIIATSAEGYPLLGHCVYWSVDPMSIPHSELLKKVRDLGIPEDVVSVPQAKSALIRTIRDQHKNKGGDQFHRKLVDGSEIAAFAIFNQQVNENDLEVDFQSKTKIRFDKKSKQVLVDGDNKEEILKTYDQYKDQLTADQLRTMTLRYLSRYCDSVSIRDRGGVYFVPASKLEQFNLLQKLSTMIPGFAIDIVPVIETKEAKKSMWKALVGDVQAELKAMNEDLANLEDPSERSFEIRLDRYKTLRAKVETYEVLLSGTAEDLKNELQGLTSQLHKKLV